MRADEVSDSTVVSVADLPATWRQRRFAFLVAMVFFSGFAILAPFADRPLPHFPAAIVAQEAIMVVNDLITSVLLFAQYSIGRSRALLVLAGGYLFTSLIIVPHALTFPNAFTPTGLLDAGLQSTAYLYYFWHIGYPVAIAAYAALKSMGRSRMQNPRSASSSIFMCTVLVVGLVISFTWIATGEQNVLPTIFTDDTHAIPARLAIVHGLLFLAAAIALAALWVRRRSVLDYWLMLVAWALILEQILVAELTSARYTLGFYSGRGFSLITSLIVLILLLRDTTLLYARLARSNTLLERERRELRGLNAQLDERVHARTAQLQSILDTVPDATIIIDERGLIHSFSAAAERIFGYRPSEVECRNVSMLMPSPDRERRDQYLDRYFTTGERHIIGIGRIVTAQRKNGTTMPMELAVGEVSLEGRRHFVGFLRDLTQRQERERRLHEVQSELLHVSRVSSLGQMASALAHELNQPLSAVTNYVRGAKRIVANMPDERAGLLGEALDKAGDQVLRAGQIVQHLREFMTQGDTEKRVESIGRIIEEAAVLALMAAKEQAVQVTYHLDPAADGVLVDKIQIQQILLNLLRNAIEAMQSCERRELAISTMPTSDGMIAVTVADTGPGIEPDVMSKLFQPFVTTKTKGMGVGLSISRTIVESHGGKIMCQARPTGGTVFRFTLPMADVTENADFDHAGNASKAL